MKISDLYERAGLVFDRQVKSETEFLLFYIFGADWQRDAIDAHRDALERNNSCGYSHLS